MAGGANGGDGLIDGINVTPLVDVMLVLLVIFMVTAKLVVAPQSAVAMTLPKAATAQAVQVIFSLQLTADGRTFVDGRQIAGDGSIRSLASAALKAHPDLRAVIQADGEVPHKRVIRAMDLLSQANVVQIAFAAEAVAADEQQP